MTLTSAGTELRARAVDIPARLFPRYGIDLDTARSLKDQLTRIVETLDSAETTPAH